MYRDFSLTLMVNHACNLRCSYCYTGRKFERAMPRGVADGALAAAWGALEPGGRLSVGFFGGEPLLEAGLVRELMVATRAEAAARGSEVEFVMTTNGTITDPIAWEVMTQPDMALALSCDGAPATHDRHRLGADGEASAATVAATLGRLLAAGVSPTVVVVVRPDSVAELTANLDYLRGLGVPRVDVSLDLWTHWPAEARGTLMAQVEAAAELWARHFPRFGVSWFDEKALLFVGREPTGAVRCGYGKGEVAVAPSGRLYPCERLIGADNTAAQSASIGMLGAATDFTALAGAGTPGDETCEACAVRSACSTICRCSNRIRTGDPTRPDGLLCEWNKCIMRATADKLRRPLNASEVPG